MPRQTYCANDCIANGNFGSSLKISNHTRQVVFFAVLWSEPGDKEPLFTVVAISG
jgi:hypothetical protein